MTPTIAERWAEFERDVLPPDVPAVQRAAMRRVFYVGCNTMMGLITSIDDDTPDEAGALMLERWSRELGAFYRDVKAGRA